MPAYETPAIDQLRDQLPDAAKDLRLNLGSVLRSELLTPAQTLGTALTCAFFLQNKPITEALLADAGHNELSAEVIDDARAAAALMGMNTIYYRFRHTIEKEVYSQKPARLRMQRMMQVKTNKGDFELFSLAAAALEGCGMCIKAHEDSILKHKMTDEHVHEAVRIAAVIKGVAIALDLPA